MSFLQLVRPWSIRHRGEKSSRDAPVGAVVLPRRPVTLADVWYEVAAPRNQYTQLYCETSGRPGDLRISRVTDGDPVVLEASARRGSVCVNEG